jgi:hypothetical protein
VEPGNVVRFLDGWKATHDKKSFGRDVRQVAGNHVRKNPMTQPSYLHFGQPAEGQAKFSKKSKSHFSTLECGPDSQERLTYLDNLNFLAIVQRLVQGLLYLFEMKV